MRSSRRSNRTIRVERYEGLGVDVIKGEGRITSPWTVEVNGRSLSARNIIVATGGRPFVPPIKGLDTVDYLTSHNLWELTTQAEAAGGYSAAARSVASCRRRFRRLGSEVWQVEMGPRIMSREDPEIAERVKQRFESDGVNVMVDTKATAVEKNADGDKVLVCERDGETLTLPFDEIIVAVGRAANSEGFGLQELGIRTRKNGTIETNEFLQSDMPNIYAVGDVAGPYQFTHTASHQAWFAAVNSLFGFIKRFRADYRVIPWATFTDPEVARVGLNETDAKEQQVPYEVTTFDIGELDRAIADGSDQGVIKVLTVPGKDTILGVTICCEHAGDLIAEYVLAMKHKIGLNKILGTIHIYPTMAEMNKSVAGEWKRANQPHKVLALLERFFRWRRG